MMPSVKVNLGCGPVQPDGWINVDGSLRARLARYAPWLDGLLVKLRLIPPTRFGRHITVRDLTKPLPFATESVDCFYAGEVLEHLLPEEGWSLVKECARCLKPGGVLRICVPDSQAFWSNYLRGVQAELAKPVEDRSDAHSNHYMKMFFDDICVRRPWFNSMGHYHKWGYDEINLTALFRRLGFVDVARRKFHDSAIPDIDKVERSDFLIVEGRKPEKGRRFTGVAK